MIIINYFILKVILICITINIVYMDVTTILIIVNICVSAIAGPLVLGISDIMKRLQKSDCCGCHIELQELKGQQSTNKLDTSIK